MKHLLRLRSNRKSRREPLSTSEISWATNSGCQRSGVPAMEYDALVAKVIELLQREKRIPYRSLKRRFDLDDAYIDDLKIDLIEAKRLAIDENDRILVWIGDA